MPSQPDYQLPGFRSRFLAVLRRYTDRPAMSSGSETWSYAQLERRIFEVGTGLMNAGLRPGDGIGILSRNTLDYAAVQLAVPLFGMYFMSLYELEGTHTHVGQVDYANLRAVVVDPGTAAGRAEELSEALSGDVKVLTLGPAGAGQDLNALSAKSTPLAPKLDSNPHQIVELGLTGGTTGTAKAVIDTDSVYLNQALIHAANYDLPYQPRMLLSTPLSHGIGSVALKTILLLGGSVVLQPYFDEEQVLETIEKERIDSLLLVPSSVYRVLDADSIGKRNLSSLECLIYGGSPMSPDRVAEAVDRFGPVLVQQYGGREAKVSAILGKRDHDPSRPDLLGSAGQPCVGVDIQMLDENLQVVPQGEMGEICVRTPAAVPGYWRNPEETEALHKGGWVHTGDLGVADERGYITIKDRLKQIIISGGHNVIPRDVEDALAAFPGVKDVAVFGVPDPRWGEAVKAAIVVRPDAKVNEEELLAFVKGRVGPVNAPKSIDYHSELPLTTAGKIDKKQLRKPYWENEARSVS